jgi:hypothetical protein
MKKKWAEMIHARVGAVRSTKNATETKGEDL